MACYQKFERPQVRIMWTNESTWEAEIENLHTN